MTGITRRGLMANAAASLGAASLAAPALAQSERTRVLRFIPQIDLVFLDPVFSMTNITRNHAGLVKSLAAFRTKQGKGGSPDAPFDHWADILWMQQAMFDAPGARKAWDARPANFKPEAGNSLTFTEAWISAFERNGPVPSVATPSSPWQSQLPFGSGSR
jgi:hypothetical protein